jgi:hypothetical protein
MQSGCLMKILEVERWLKGTNFHEVAFLRRQDGRVSGVPRPGARKVERHDACGEREDMVALQGGRPPFKGDSPYLCPQPLRVESSPTRSKILPPMVRGLGPTHHASRPRAEEAKPPDAVHATARRLQAVLHFCPDQRAKGRAAIQAACNRAKWAHLSDFQRAQHGGPGPRVMQPVRRLLRVSNCTATHATTAPPRLRSQYHDSRQPCSASQARRSNTVKIGPAVMVVTGGQKQRPRRQPSSRPIQGQRGSPLPRREDGAPVIRSSNGSHTRNGRPANRSPRRINSAAGQAVP